MVIHFGMIGRRTASLYYGRELLQVIHSLQEW
jgi:hypothetical protein